jgi:hypothetical protein
MKKIVKEGVLEEPKFYCDKHPDRECFSELKTASWYGSKFDMMGIELHLCDVCLFDLYKQLQKDFGIEPTSLDI